MTFNHYLLVMSVENMTAHDAITPPRMINVEKEVKIIIILGFTIFQRGVNCKDKKNSLQWDLLKQIIIYLF